jgi:hypothetical protein
MRRRAAVATWIAEHGYVCPGYGVPPHQSRRLQADHVQPVSLGGDPGGELQVLCRTCNVRKDGRNRLHYPPRVEMSLCGYSVAWAMFAAQETERIEMADELWEGFEGDDADLVRSMSLVAAILRKELVNHASQVDCDCGSDEWLEKELLRARAYEADHDEDEDEDEDG